MYYLAHVANAFRALLLYFVSYASSTELEKYHHHFSHHCSSLNVCESIPIRVHVKMANFITEINYKL